MFESSGMVHLHSRLSYLRQNRSFRSEENQIVMFLLSHRNIWVIFGVARVEILFHPCWSQTADV